MTIIFLPFRGEFGQMLMAHVRWVHGIKAERKIVCCRRGDEPLFPSATGFFYDWVGVTDDQRHTQFLMSKENSRYLESLEPALLTLYPKARIRFPLDGLKPQRFPWCPQHNFVPEPAGKAPHRFPDILVAPRFRKHGAHRNFQYWDDVIDGLELQGFRVGLLGTSETSVDRLGLPLWLKAWNYEDNLGITLHWMQQAKLVLCTDSGIAHLAVLAGAPLQVIYGKEGVEAGKEEWRWAFGHMKAHAVNYCEAVTGGWSDSAHVISAVVAKVPPPPSDSCGCRTSRYPGPCGISAATNT